MKIGLHVKLEVLPDICHTVSASGNTNLGFEGLTAKSVISCGYCT